MSGSLSNRTASDAPERSKLLLPGASTGRGLLYISGAKLWFMMAGLLMQLLLPRAFGSAALFGMWSLVLAWVSTPNNVMVTATIQTVSFFSAAGPLAVEEAKRTALRMQVLVGGGACLLFLLLAPVIASFEHDGELTGHLRLASIIVLCYSFYAVFVGAANGARQFHKQAGLDVSFSTMRTGLILAAAWTLHSTLWAVSGFVLAAATITLVSVAVVGPPRRLSGEPIAVRTMLRFSAWLLLYLTAINLLMFMDGFWLKRLCTEALSGQADRKRTVDALVGVYSAAQNVARLPYQLILAGAFVIFPVMSRAAIEKDQGQTRRYIAATLRYSLIATMAMVIALMTRPAATMRLLYPGEYATGAPALRVLLLGYACFSLLTIIGTITNGVGRIKATTAIGLFTVAITACTVPVCVRSALLQGEQPLRMAAWGMVAGMAAGLLLALLYLWHTFRVTFPVLTVLRVALAAAIALGLGRFWPAPGTQGLLGSKLGTVLCAGLSPLIYLGVLLLLREVSRAEVLSLRRPGSGRGAAGGGPA